MFELLEWILGLFDLDNHEIEDPTADLVGWPEPNG